MVGGLARTSDASGGHTWFFLMRGVGSAAGASSLKNIGLFAQTTHLGPPTDPNERTKRAGSHRRK